MQQSTVLTVLLNWRTPEMTLRALEAAREAMHGVTGEIVVVDNASGDGSFDIISDRVTAEGWDDVCVLQSGRNGGFGAGNNVGIRANLSNGTQPDYVYILNSDAFPAPDAIAALRDHLDQHPKAGFAGSHIRGPDGEPHLTTFRFPSILSELEGSARIGPISRLLGRWAVPVPIPAATRKVDWLAGASLMMRTSVLNRIGQFDERFFLYFEETDLCRRANRAGHEVHYVVESQVVHIGSVSTGMKDWQETPGYWFESRWHYFSKNHGTLYAICASLAHVLGGGFHRLRCLLTGRKPADPPHFLRRLIAHDVAALFKRTQDKTAPERVTGA